MLHTASEPTVEECVSVVQNLISETSLTHVYNALQGKTFRDRLNILGPIWQQLEPQLKEKINEIKAAIRKKKSSSDSTTKLPPQYPTTPDPISALLATVDSTMCSDNESDGTTDNEALQARAFHITSPDTLEVCAHIELVVAYA